VVLGVLLIPVVSSSLDGLTHVLTCQGSTNAPFTLEVPPQGPATILSAVTIQRGQHQICGGLSLDIGVHKLTASKVQVILPIANHTRYRWRGSVNLHLGHTSVPVNVGEIRPGATRSAHVDVHIDPGEHAIGGSLLIGP